MQPLLLALQLVVQAPAPTPAFADSIWAQVDSAINAFQMEWRGTWAATPYHRPAIARSSSGAPIGYEATLRAVALHCHWSTQMAGPDPGAISRSAMISKFIITNGTSHASSAKRTR